MVGITRQQANWASQHDWFHSMHKTDGMWYCVAVVESATGEMLEFIDFDELQAWAGY